jgi:hypothetical protein
MIVMTNRPCLRAVLFRKALHERIGFRDELPK